MTRVLAMLLVTAGILSCAAAAHATGTRAQYAQVGKACSADLERLCPALAGPGSDGRDRAICLKPYSTSLSLGCRGTVRAVTR